MDWLTCVAQQIHVIQSGCATELTLLVWGGREGIWCCPAYAESKRTSLNTNSEAKWCLLQIAVLIFLCVDVTQQGCDAVRNLGCGWEKKLRQVTRVQRKCTTPHRELWHYATCIIFKKNFADVSVQLLESVSVWHNNHQEYFDYFSSIFHVTLRIYLIAWFTSYSGKNCSPFHVGFF